MPVPSTSVKWMHSGMTGAPVLGNNWGDLTALLRACAVNGFNVKPIQPGEGTCYGLTWKADKPGFLATVDCGYADGLPRGYQGDLHVGIGGYLYPQVGRICMDQLVVDLGRDGGGVSEGDRAVLFGAGGPTADADNVHV